MELTNYVAFTGTEDSLMKEFYDEVVAEMYQGMLDDGLSDIFGEEVPEGDHKVTWQGEDDTTIGGVFRIDEGDEKYVTFILASGASRDELPPGVKEISSEYFEQLVEKYDVPID